MGSTPLGNTSDPDVMDTAERLQTQWGYNCNLDPSKVMPSVHLPGARPNFENLLKNSVEGIKHGAVEAQAKGINIRPITEAAQHSLEYVHAMRRSLSQWLKDNGHVLGYQIELKDPKPVLPNCDTYDEIDIDRTVTANPRMYQMNSSGETAKGENISYTYVCGQLAVFYL